MKEKTTLRTSNGNEQILLVDDDELVLKITATLLEHIGYRVITRTSGMEALDELMLRAHEIDLVITDCAMPHMRGEELAREIFHMHNEMPVILYTGGDRALAGNAGDMLGVRRVALKPMNKNQLEKLVRSVLDDDRVHKEEASGG